MNAAGKFQNINLARKPKIFRTAKGARIWLRVITPFRFLIIDKFIMEPLIGVWKFLIAIYVINFGISAMEWGNMFNHLPFTQESFLVFMAIPLALWVAERFCGYPLHRLFFGKNIFITIKEDDVIVWSGLQRNVFPRHRIAFVHYGFQSPITSAYRRSDRFGVVVDGSNEIVLAQIFGGKIVRNLVNNANIALRMPTAQSGRDIDPTRRQPA